MNDDTERRLRHALGSADLPGAPETLRASMRAIAGSAPAVSRGRRPWLRALPALAAVVVVAVAAGALSGGFGRLGLATPSAAVSVPASGPSSTGSESTSSATAASVAPPASSSVAPTAPASAPPLLNAGVPVYAASELEAKLASDRASLVGRPVVVLGHVSHGFHIVCGGGSDVPSGCLGQLDDTKELVSATLYTSTLLERPTAGDPLSGAMAFTVLANGLEYLGHMAYGAKGEYEATVSELQASPSAATSVLDTYIVSGWLVASPPLRCLLPPGSPPLADTPFINCPWAWLTPTEEQPTTVGDNSMSVTPPADGVRVQWSAYDDFAPDPVSTPIPEPRFGTYLVRLVQNTSEGAKGATGWQVVGRLDSGQEATAPVYTPAELGALLASDRASWVGKAVLVDGSISASVPTVCDMTGTPPATCDIGKIEGIAERVVVSQYTSSLLAGGPAPNGVLAMRVRADGLEYLGYMIGGDHQATLPDLSATASNPPAGPVTFIVSAWLGTSGPLPCQSVPGSPPPADTPFGSGCPSSWLAPTDQQVGYGMPAGGVPVQFSAYQEFAPGASDLSGPPRYGTYLVRLVVDTRQGADGPRGWQVVARLAP